jgi:hypothetical protein
LVASTGVVRAGMRQSVPGKPVGQIRARWQKVRMILRGDCGFFAAN